MQQIVGYRLVRTSDGAEVQYWGGAWGQCPGIPNPVVLPNGDQVCAPSLDADIGGHKLVAWIMDKPAPTAGEVVQECERRLALGFDYDFGDARGVHRIGTSTPDMIGWDEVSKLAGAMIALGNGAGTVDIVTNTGAATVTALEWQSILVAAAQFRQPIWAKSFALQAMSPIPADFDSDTYWT